ncbi:T9SS type A sorting domain-containing protein, partial [candidate division WOR-3 bacterium]|nr:T9SS type A sorting domain-containing protein [candidate division WOR-3 bacterium]
FTLGPALTVDTSGKIWAGWLGCDSVENWKVYASCFEDSVWSVPMLVSEPAGWGDYPVAITSDDRGNVWLTWMNSDDDIYYSYWNGNKWSDPAPIDTHPALDYYPKMTFNGKRIWVTWIRQIGSNQYAIYASYTYGVGVEEKPVANLSPSALKLDPSYPNPFSLKTAISYQLPCDCYVSLRIYDIAGNLVRTLVNKDQKAAHYSVNWNGKDNQNRHLPGGVYFVRLEAEGYAKTEKVVLLQ